MLTVYITQVSLLLCLMWYVTILELYPEDMKPSTAQMKRYVSTGIFLIVLLAPEILRLDSFKLGSGYIYWVSYIVTSLALSSIPLLHYHHRYIFNPDIGHQFAYYLIIIVAFLTARYWLGYYYGTDQASPPLASEYSQFILTSTILIYNSIAILVLMLLRNTARWNWLYVSLSRRSMKANLVALVWWVCIVGLERQLLLANGQ